MRIVKFKYTVYHDAKNPIIPLRIKGKHSWKVIWAYVDSGASFSILTFSEAQRLGIEPNKGKRIEMIVGNGEKINVHLFRMRAKLEDVEFKTIVGFSKQLGSGFNLIGRKNVFEKFKVCFDDKQGLLTFFRN